MLALAASGLVQAQAWPSKPVRIIVPISVGGATDLLGRTLAQALQQSTGQPFVVENKTGAAGAIGSAEVARAAPDGYTLLIATTSTHSIAPHVSNNLPYNVVDDFTPIALLAEANNVLLMSPTLQSRTLGELLAAGEREARVHQLLEQRHRLVGPLELRALRGPGRRNADPRSVQGNVVVDRGPQSGDRAPRARRRRCRGCRS